MKVGEFVKPINKLSPSMPNLQGACHAQGDGVFRRSGMQAFHQGHAT
ncbi:MAG: hypothetical protein IV105_12345 [Rhizobacter sp.]|nr:hypothetical protein [Rhizobacter sp.]